MSLHRILYLEDETNDVELLRSRLIESRISADLVHVDNPLDFATALKTKAPDLILTDGKVGGFGGEAALHMAHAVCPHVPAFCLSGTVNNAKVAAMKAAGALDCLSKDDASSVLSAIRRSLG